MTLKTIQEVHGEKDSNKTSGEEKKRLRLASTLVKHKLKRYWRPVCLQHIHCSLLARFVCTNATSKETMQLLIAGKSKQPYSSTVQLENNEKRTCFNFLPGIYMVLSLWVPCKSLAWLAYRLIIPTDKMQPVKGQTSDTYGPGGPNCTLYLGYHGSRR